MHVDSSCEAGEEGSGLIQQPKGDTPTAGTLEVGFHVLLSHRLEPETNSLYMYFYTY